jgi:Dyp-type peroxidase family
VTDVGSWRLNATHAANAQGLLVSPFEHLPEAQALLLRLPCGGRWLAALRVVCPITPATGRSSPASAIAFTATGLAAMGLDDITMRTFSRPFLGGMHQTDRQRRLSDNAAAGTTILGGPEWGGNAPSHSGVAGSGTAPPTPETVHGLLLLYAETKDALAIVVDVVKAALRDNHVEIVRFFGLSLRLDENGIGREHFGFADGISQPVPHGDAILTKGGARYPVDPLHGIAAGDIMMGHTDANGELAPGPVLSDTLPSGTLARFRDLGTDGSYLVVRELRQDVAAFWDSMYDAFGGKEPDQAIWVASRVVGRTMDGDVLTPEGSLAAVRNASKNDFTYFAADPYGLGCPVGSHVRRANPRDGLAPEAGMALDLLAGANNHRILRRGRKFGPTIDDPRKDDGITRGLLFMCLNTDLVRQFEFVQQSWLLNPNFGTLLNETDPLLGPRGRFTIPAKPLRLRPTIDTFIRFAGGEYFFLPSLLALDYLQTLPEAAQ